MGACVAKIGGGCQSCSFFRKSAGTGTFLQKRRKLRFETLFVPTVRITWYLDDYSEFQNFAAIVAAKKEAAEKGEESAAKKDAEKWMKKAKTQCPPAFDPEKQAELWEAAQASASRLTGLAVIAGALVLAFF